MTMQKAAGWHFLGWALVLIGSAGWTSGRLRRALCSLYPVGGIAALFVYVLPALEGAAVWLGTLWAVWQGILLWQDQPEAVPTAEEPMGSKSQT